MSDKEQGIYIFALPRNMAQRNSVKKIVGVLDFFSCIYYNYLRIKYNKIQSFFASICLNALSPQA